jgi:chaperonin GroES
LENSSATLSHPLGFVRVYCKILEASIQFVFSFSDKPPFSSPTSTVSLLQPASLFFFFFFFDFSVYESAAVYSIVTQSQLPKGMATVHLTTSSILAGSLSSFEGLRPSKVRISTVALKQVGSSLSSFRSLVVKASTTVAPKYTSLKPLGDRVLVKTKPAEEQTVGGILLPSSAQSKPQGGEVVAVGDDKKVRPYKIDTSVTGTQVVHSKYTGTEVELNGSNHLILKEEDIIGILETDDIKDMKPLNDYVLLKVADAEEKTAGGLYLTSAAKDFKPSTSTVIAAGPGCLDGNGDRTPLPVSPGDTVLYSKFSGNDFKGTDGSQYVALKASELMGVLS